MRSNITRHYISQRATLSKDEGLLVDCVLYELHRAAKLLSVPIETGDPLVDLEAALIKLVLNSREI